jgi:hypothetical protein
MEKVATRIRPNKKTWYKIQNTSKKMNDKLNKNLIIPISFKKRQNKVKEKQTKAGLSYQS